MTQEKDIGSVLRELGISYRVVGKEAVASCPSHKDRHPSWSCNLTTGVHHCFACGFSGNLASLVALMLRLNYAEAVIWCNERVGWARAHVWREDYENKNYAPDKFRISEADMALFTDPPEDMLASRNISAEAARAYEVRWNPAEEQWVFPIRDPYTNDLWGWQLKNGRLFRSYPAGIKKSETLFGLGAFSNECPPVLVESPIDSVRLLTSGVRSGVSSLGVSVSARQLSIILGISDSLVLALDNDSAGVAETARICRTNKQIPSLWIFSYGMTGAKDPGEMSDLDIMLGMANAVSSIRWLREYDNLKREFASLSGRASREISFEKELASRLLNGTR